jgi:MFS family permease
VRRWSYPALAFLTGAAVTILEFSAPNLFRAYFGQTLYIWANVIGVILAALAAGYALGGRWADRTSTAAPLVAVLAFAGAYGLLVAWLGPRVSLWLAGPEEYPQDAALPAFVVESLAASLLLFGPPLLALGMATPLLVQRASASWPVGRAAGVVFGVGTAGSIAGIYLTTFVLLERLGVRATIALAGAALLVLAAAGLLLDGRRRSAGLCVAGVALVPLGTAPPWADLPPEGSRLVLAIESPYQLVRVVDRPPEEGVVHRWLAFDEGMGTFHSMRLDPVSGRTGAYYDVFAFAPEWVGGAGPFRICIVGNAAGTMVDLLHRHHDPATLLVDAVEIDPRVTRAAREAMGLEDRPNVHLFHEDGRTFLARQPEGRYDIVVLDAYARQVSVPAALATREFFALVRSRLREGGMVFVNVGALRPGGLLVQTLADTVAKGFAGPVYRCPLAEYQQNVLLVAARGGAAPPPPKGTPFLVPWSFAPHDAGDRVLTDDRCPVESLTMRDLQLR